MFNLWLNCAYDAANQAIKDIATGRYIAIDLGVHGTDPEDMSDEGRLDKIVDKASRNAFGQLFADPESTSDIQNIVDRIQTVDDSTIETIFSDYVGPTDKKQRMIQSLKWRRDHIDEMMSTLLASSPGKMAA